MLRQKMADIFDQVYDELRKLARARMAQERVGHTLQATALVNEVYLRMAASRADGWVNRAQFFKAAATAMQRILIDHARARNAAKRRGRQVELSDQFDLADQHCVEDAMILTDLLSRMEQEDARSAQVVRLRFFSGLSVEETAAVLGVSTPSVKRDWAFARAWLAEALSHDGKDD